MDTRRIVVGTLVGGVVSYVVGYLIFDMAFGGFYAANVGSATGFSPGSRWTSSCTAARTSRT